MKKLSQVQSVSEDEVFQERILPGVSRTFALTIPQLPGPLRRAVTNAYLLCRIADTIEDEVSLASEHKLLFHRLLIDVLARRADAREFARYLYPLLSARSLPAERELVRNTPRVVAVTHALDPATRSVLQHRIGIMCDGMPHFQQPSGGLGLHSLAALDRYCYYVAGVVGEMLTELFCDYSDSIATRRDALFALSPSFGQGLQMTNILKDIWDDLGRGICWLPRDVFAEVDYDIDRVSPDHQRDKFARGLRRLVGIAHTHLQHALSYTLHIPQEQVGVRKFCLWSLGLAVLTLRRIHLRPDFTSAQHVKVSRGVVRATAAITRMAAGSDRLIQALFSLYARRLPVANDVRSPVVAPSS